MFVRDGGTRKLDQMGRVVIPKSIRLNNNLKEGDYIDFYVDTDSNSRQIFLKKTQSGCIFCNSKSELIEHNNIRVCEKCYQKMSEKFA